MPPAPYNLFAVVQAVQGHLDRSAGQITRDLLSSGPPLVDFERRLVEGAALAAVVAQRALAQHIIDEIRRLEQGTGTSEDRAQGLRALFRHLQDVADRYLRVDDVYGRTRDTL